MTFINHLQINEFFSTNRLELNKNKKDFFSSILFLFVIYFLAIFSIIRANFNYVDDVRRSIVGNGMRGDFSRHISQFLSYFLHTNSRLTDISPLPQFVACLFLSLAGFMLVKIICNKANKFLLFASLPLGLSPYFLSCFSYKFDAPYMALSILASIFPFLFMQKNKWIFAFICIASILVMTMTYQAASGIFIMLALFIFFTNLMYKKDTVKNNFIFLGISCLSYSIALIMFQLFFKDHVISYVSTDLPKIENMTAIFLRNIQIYFTNIDNDFNIIWKILSIAVMILFYIKTIIFSKLNKILSFFLTSIFLFLLIIPSFGLYSILENPLFAPRTMYGIGFFLAILCVDICFSLKKFISFPAIVLCWCFLVFSFAYGNALDDQKRYNNFRTELLIHDLASLFPVKTEEPYSLTIVNNIGYSPVVENVAVNNPVVKRLVHINLKERCPFVFIHLSQYHKFKFNWIHTPMDEPMPVIFDSYYHTIQNKDKRIVVILK
jgi:hypothetical protein